MHYFVLRKRPLRCIRHSEKMGPRKSGHFCWEPMNNVIRLHVFLKGIVDFPSSIETRQDSRGDYDNDHQTTDPRSVL